MSSPGKGGKAGGSKGGSRSAGGGGGGAAGDADLEKLQQGYKERPVESDSLSDTGNLVKFYGDEVETNVKPNAEFVKAFKEGKMNMNPILVTQIGKDRYRAVDRSGAELAASAKAAGTQLNMVIVPRDARDIKAARASRKLGDPPAFAKPPTGKSSLSDVGNYVRLYSNEVTGKASTSSATKAAARSQLSTNSRNWSPVLVRQKKNGKYEVVGNQKAYAAAKQSGGNIWSVVVAED